MQVICDKCSSTIVVDESRLRSREREDCFPLSSSLSRSRQAIKSDELHASLTGSFVVACRRASSSPESQDGAASSSSPSLASLSSSLSSPSLASLFSLSSLPWSDVIFPLILRRLHVADLFRLRRVSRSFCLLIDCYFQQLDHLDLQSVSSTAFNSHSFAVIVRQKTAPAIKAARDWKACSRRQLSPQAFQPENFLPDSQSRKSGEKGKARGDEGCRFASSSSR